MNQEARKPGKEMGDSGLTHRVIGAAIRVHRELGPGFLESVYEQALDVELGLSGIAFERQKTVPVLYRNIPVGEHRLDFLIDGQVILELKAVSELTNIHFATVRSYLKATGLHDALLLNFASPTLLVKRVGREVPIREQADVRV